MSFLITELGIIFKEDMVTLTNKKSRAISVDGKDYRYQVSTTRIDYDWKFTLNLTVQRWNPPRAILEVKGLITRDHWLDISDGAKWKIDDYPVLLPRHIASIINASELAGWESQVTGKSFTLHTNNGAIFKAI